MNAAETLVVLSPLSLNPLTRDTWGQFDTLALAQLAPLATDDCFQLKLYKAPADTQESLGASGNSSFATYGMRITPGSLIFGFYLPCVPTPGNLPASVPPAFTVQIRDVALKHRIFSEPVASLFLSNYKPTYQGVFTNGTVLNAGSFPNLLTAPYPVVGQGLFTVEIQNTAGVAQRVELVFGVLEKCG